MVKGTTKSGLKFSVDPDVINDMEFIELAASAGENGLALPRLIEWVLGEKQKKALYDHVRNAKGRVLVSDIKPEFDQILEAINKHNQTKNS